MRVQEAEQVEPRGTSHLGLLCIALLSQLQWELPHSTDPGDTWHVSVAAQEQCVLEPAHSTSGQEGARNGSMWHNCPRVLHDAHSWLSYFYLFWNPAKRCWGYSTCSGHRKVSTPVGTRKLTLMAIYRSCFGNTLLSMPVFSYIIRWAEDERIFNLYYICNKIIRKKSMYTAVIIKILTRISEAPFANN